MFLGYLSRHFAALIDHCDKMYRFQCVRAVFSVEWNKIGPERIIEKSSHMQLKCFFSDFLFGDVSIVVSCLPLNEAF